MASRGRFPRPPIFNTKPDLVRIRGMVTRSGTGAGAVLRALANAGLFLWNGVGTLLYPPLCLGCGDRLADPLGILCLPCLGSADRAELYEIDERLRRLPAARQAIDFAFSLWLFDKGGLLQDVHHALKYGNKPVYGRILGEVLGREFLDAWGEKPLPSIIIPIPLHRSRQYERGYNQSEMLAQGVSLATGISISTSLLARGKSTRSQTKLSRKRRWANLAGAFHVTNADMLAGHSVLLIDDVLTTGSTAGVAAKALREAGAQSVHLATLAMARR